MKRSLLIVEFTMTKTITKQKKYFMLTILAIMTKFGSRVNLRNS